MGKPSLVDDLYGAHLFGAKVPVTRNSSKLYEKQIEALLANKLIELCVNRFKWHGLPRSVDVRYLEMTLFYQGLSVFYWDREYDKYFALQGTGSGQDMHGNPLRYKVLGNQFVSRTMSATDCVPIWSNYTRQPADLTTVSIYARRLAKLDRTIEINTDNARQPRILTASENTRLTVENINRQVDEGVPVIRVNDSYDPSAIASVLDMGVDHDMFDKLGVMRSRVWSECMGLLGIDNANQEKKERLVESEVGANSEQTAYMKAVNLNARQIAANQISRKYKLDIDVEYNQDVVQQLALTEDNPTTPPLQPMNEGGAL